MTEREYKLIRSTINCLIEIGRLSLDQTFNDMEYQAEQNECVNMYLDDLGIPKEDAAGEKYSTVGRVKYLEQNGF